LPLEHPASSLSATQVPAPPPPNSSTYCTMAEAVADSL